MARDVHGRERGGRTRHPRDDPPRHRADPGHRLPQAAVTGPASVPQQGSPVHLQFEVAPDLPAHLQIGFLRPGATHTGFGRFSRSQSFRRRDGDLDQRGFAFRLETDLGPQDFLLSNTPVSFARDPVEFLTVASIFVESPMLIAPLRVIRALGPGDGLRVLANLLRPPARTIAFTSQRYWSRTPFQFGEAAARLLVRPEGEPCRVSRLEDPDFLTFDLVQALQRHARSFELCAQLFVDDQRTPIEDASRPWLETDAPPVVLGRVILPTQDLEGHDARDLAERVERMDAFSPWTTASLRPLGRSNRARREAYSRSATHGGAHAGAGAAAMPSGRNEGR